jgi:hypothetical protein
MTKPKGKVSTDEFRWISQLSTSAKLIRAELHEFYDSHNKNVLAFQALVDDPIQSISSREKTLDTGVYHRILETDLSLHSAKGLVTEIEMVLMDLMEICREKYVADKMYPLLERQFGAPALDRRLMMLPEYANSQPTKPPSFEEDPGASVKRRKLATAPRNQWILTNADGKVIESPSEERRSRSFDLSSTRSASDGVLSCEEALIQAFVGVSELLNHLSILPNDVCSVHIDGERHIATVTCQRWGNYVSEKTIRLNKVLQQIGADHQFYFKCQPVEPQSEKLCEVRHELLSLVLLSSLPLSLPPSLSHNSPSLTPTEGKK